MVSKVTTGIQGR